MTKAKIKQALILAGHEHRYQKMLVLLISLSSVLFNFVTLGSTFIFLNPTFNCNDDINTKVHESDACKIIDQCQITDNFTLTAELKLYCQKEWIRDLIQSIFAVGAIAGLFVINLISDMKGRKISMIIGLTIICVGVLTTLTGALVKSIYFVVVAQFIQGFGTSSMLSLSYTFLADYCSQRFKPRAIIFVNSAWSLSTALIGIFYLVEINWKSFLIFGILIPLTLVTFSIYIYVYQSPYILMLQNKNDEILNSLQKIAFINQKYENIDKIKEVIERENRNNIKQKASLKNIYNFIQKWIYLKPLIVISLIRIIGCLNFYGTSFAFSSEGLGLGYNSIIASAMELLAFMFLTVYVNKIPRKKGIAGFYSLVVVVGILFFFEAIKNNLITATVLMGISRIFSTTAYTLIASMQTQSFTAEIQSTAVGITEAFGLIGALSGPLIVDLSYKIGIDPVALIAIFVNFAVWPNIFLKETLNNHFVNKEKEPLLVQNPQENQKQNYIDSILSQSADPSLQDC